MQNRKDSLKESITNVLIGIVIAFICNMLILPVFGYNITAQDSLGISLIYTAISIIRSYTVRRFFNKKGK